MDLTTNHIQVHLIKGGQAYNTHTSTLDKRWTCLQSTHFIKGGLAYKTHTSLMVDLPTKHTHFIKGGPANKTHTSLKVALPTQTCFYAILTCLLFPSSTMTDCTHLKHVVPPLCTHLKHPVPPILQQTALTCSIQSIHYYNRLHSPEASSPSTTITDCTHLKHPVPLLL